MGDTLDFPAFPGQPELDGMDRAQLLSCLERIQLMLEHLDELEPEDMDSDAYEVWGERHEALEDLADELQDRLDELNKAERRALRGAPPFHSLSAQQATASRKNRAQPGTALS
ncbi:MAG: hypothetical protein ACLRWQ_14550 [Flavonifractor plautii]